MKKLLSIIMGIICFCNVVIFTACDGSGNSTSNSSASPSGSSTSSSPIGSSDSPSDSATPNSSTPDSATSENGTGGDNAGGEKTYKQAEKPYYTNEDISSKEQYKNFNVYYHDFYICYRNFLKYYTEEYKVVNTSDFYFIDLEKYDDLSETGWVMRANTTISLYADDLQEDRMISPLMTESFSVYDCEYEGGMNPADQKDGVDNTINAQAIFAPITKTKSDVFTFEFGEAENDSNWLWRYDKYFNVYVEQKCIATIYYWSVYSYKTGKPIEVSYEWLENFFINSLYEG